MQRNKGYLVGSEGETWKKSPLAGDGKADEYVDERVDEDGLKKCKHEASPCSLRWRGVHSDSDGHGK